MWGLLFKIEDMFILKNSQREFFVSEPRRNKNSKSLCFCFSYSCLIFFYLFIFIFVFPKTNCIKQTKTKIIFFFCCWSAIFLCWSLCVCVFFSLMYSISLISTKQTSKKQTYQQWLEKKDTLLLPMMILQLWSLKERSILKTFHSHISFSKLF